MVSINPKLLNHVCRIVEEKSGCTIPFRLRGITIKRDLIEAAITILNDSPEKTLPQNCRNDIRSRTPDGLDRRIKDYLNTDLRTANIISDVLAEAGVVEIVSVINPETGRRVKGTRLREEWAWGEAVGNNTITKSNLVAHSKQVDAKEFCG